MTTDAKRKALFGDAVNISRLSRMTGIDRKTLTAYFRDPDRIPLARAEAIGKTNGAELKIER